MIINHMNKVKNKIKIKMSKLLRINRTIIIKLNQIKINNINKLIMILFLFYQINNKLNKYKHKHKAKVLI
jgi:hypothetical protein